jgi:hypothetical protein
MSSESSSRDMLLFALVVIVALIEAYIWIAGQSGWD